MKLAPKKRQEKNYDKSLTVEPNREIKLKDGSRLTREEQIQVIQWLVELKSPTEIAELINEEWGKKICRQSIYFYAHSKKWKPLIARLRRRFETNLAKIPIANKADRLRYLQLIVKEGLKWSLKTITKDGDEIYELRLGAATEAIKAAKEELEPSNRGGMHIGITINLTPEEKDARRNRLREIGILN